MGQRQFESAGLEVMHPGSVYDVAVSVASRRFVVAVAASAFSSSAVLGSGDLIKYEKKYWTKNLP